MYRYRPNSIAYGGPTGETEITKCAVAFHTHHNTYHSVKQITIYGRNSEYEMLNLLNRMPSQNIYHFITRHESLASGKRVYMQRTPCGDFGPEYEHYNYPDYNYLLFYKRKAIETIHTLGNLQIRVWRLEINPGKYLLLYNSFTYDNFLVYAVCRIGIKRVFNAIVSAGILTITSLLKTMNPVVTNSTPDFHIVCGGEVIPACKLTLSHFKYFRTLFESQFNDAVLKIPDGDPTVVREVLALIHDSQLENHCKLHRPYLFMWLSLDLPALHLIEN